MVLLYHTYVRCTACMPVAYSTEAQVPPFVECVQYVMPYRLIPCNTILIVSFIPYHTMWCCDFESTFCFVLFVSSIGIVGLFAHCVVSLLRHFVSSLCLVSLLLSFRLISFIRHFGSLIFVSIWPILVSFRTGLQYSDFAVVAEAGSFGSHENVSALVKNLSSWYLRRFFFRVTLLVGHWFGCLFVGLPVDWLCIECSSAVYVAG